jgi:hypothetical protein
MAGAGVVPAARALIDGEAVALRDDRQSDLSARSSAADRRPRSAQS